MQLTAPSITEIAKAGTFGLKLPALPDNPFVGLRPFNSDEALLFFGRREQTIELLQQLYRTHFVALVGSSGCGKSSLVRAGLIPKLKAGFLVEERDQWLIATMKPGDAPLNNLADALLGATTGTSNEAKRKALVAAIHTGDADAIIERLTPALTDSDANLLLLIDQFEELFRFGLESGNAENRAEATQFVDLMLALSEQRQLPIYVVMAMRSDFLGDCDNFYGLPEAMNRSQYLIPRLTREQLRQAIEGPINLFDGSISPQLLERVLDDVGDKSDQLPPMQHALMRTWERWKFENARSGDPQVDIEHYEAIGRIEDALSKDAEAALMGMSDEHLKVTEWMFQALTDTDAYQRRIRRPLHLSEIVAITGASRERILEIIERFKSGGRSFLTVTAEADSRIEISHESLIRQWERMKDWVTKEAAWRDLYLRLSHDAGVFEKSRDNKDLLKGSQLVSALEWQKEREPNTAWAHRYHPSAEPNEAKGLFHCTIDFLGESEKVRDAEVAEKNRRRKRSQRIAWSVTSIIIGLLVVLVVFGWFAIQRDAEYRQEIYKNDMETAEEEFGSGNYSRSMSLLTRYVPAPNSWLNFLQWDVRDPRWRILWQLSHDEFATLKEHEDPVRSVVFSPNGKMLASASLDRTIKLWDIGAKRILATLTGHEGFVRSVAFSPDGKTLASASDDKTIKLWDTGTKQPIATLTGHKSSVWLVAFSPDGKTLASASDDNTIKLWDTGAKQTVATLTGHESSVRSVAFSPDGKTLASASKDTTIKLWDASTKQSIATLTGHEDSVYSVAFSLDGKMLASASLDRTVKLWDIGAKRTLATLTGHKSSVWSVAFSPDGRTLASASYDNTIKLWDTGAEHTVVTLTGHEADVRSVAFSPNGKTLASASLDRTIKLWDIGKKQTVATLKWHEADVWSVAHSPDGKTLASAGRDDKKKDFAIRLWFAATDEEVARQRNK